MKATVENMLVGATSVEAMEFVEFQKGGKNMFQEERKILSIELPQFPSAVISEDSQNYYVDLRTGLGEGIYPKDSF